MYLKHRLSTKIGVIFFALLLILSVIAVSAGIMYARAGETDVSAAQTVPYRINYQGRLTDNNGNAMPDGDYNIRFKLFDAATGGTQQWAEAYTGASRVTLTGGLFNLQLGSVTALPPNIFSTYPLYLEVELPTPSTATTTSPSWTEGPFTPRQQLASAPYAFNADQLDGYAASELAKLEENNTFTGNNTVQGDFTAEGNVILGNAATDLLTFNGTVQGANPFVLEGLSANGFETTIAVTDPTADRTITLPDESGTVCLTSGNCAGSGGGGAPFDATYLTLSTHADLSNERVLTAGANLSVTDGGANAALTIATVQNPTFTTSVTTPQLLLTNSGFTGTLQPTTLTVDRTYTLPDATGEVCLTSGNCAGTGGNGDITGSGTANRLAVFDANKNITDSYLLQSANALTLDAGKNLTVDTDTLFVDATSNRVGIGTTSPGEALDVAGNIKIQDKTLSTETVTFDGGSGSGLRMSNANGYVSVTPLNSSWAHIYTDRPNFIFNKDVYTVGSTTGFSSYSTNDLLLKTNNTTRITVQNSTGNVGIGTTSPNEKLTVNGGLNVTGAAGSSTGLTLSDEGAYKRIQTFESEPLAINPLGNNVGIGTTSPAYKLDVAGGTGITGRFSGRVIGGDAVNSDEFVTKSQLDSSTGGGTKVSSLNTLTGDVVIQGNTQIGVTTSGSDINLAIQGNSIGDTELAFNTGQHLTTASSPTFGGLTVNGQAHFNTATNTTPLVLGRTASTSSEILKLGVEDTSTVLHYINDEAASRFDFRLENTDMETGGGAAANNNVVLSILGNNSGGAVGIGTVTPGFKLDVSGTGRFTGALTLGTQATGTSHAVRADRTISAGSGLSGGGNLTADRTLSVDSTVCRTSGNCSGVGGTGDVLQGGNAFGELMTLGTTDNHSLRFITNNSEAIRILTNNNVGIGTASPQTRLEVGSNTAAAEVVTVRSQGFSGLDMIGDSANGSGEPGGAYVRLSQDGNLIQGILGMVNTAGEDGAGGTYTDTLGNSMLLGTKASNSPLHLGTNGAVQLTVASNGHVGIGTTSPAYKLDVSGGTGIVGQFSGRVIGSDAVNADEFVTKSQLDSSTGGGTKVSSLNTLTGDVVVQGNTQVGAAVSGQNINLSIQADSIGDAQLAFNTGQHLTTSHSPTFNALTLSTASETALSFDGGDALITVHDGFGNFNIKAGVDDDNIITSSAGGSHVRLDDQGYISLSVDESTAIGGTYNIGTELRIDAGNVNVQAGDLAIGGTDVITSARALQNVTDITGSGTITFSGLTANRLVTTTTGGQLANSITAADLQSSVSGTTGTAGNLVFSASPTFTGTVNTANITNSGVFTANAVSTRDKLRVWNNGTYSIGMQSSFTHGYLNDYAMTFQMSNTAARGFWWGHSGHSQAQGAMSLTTDGRLYVDNRVNVGGNVLLSSGGGDSYINTGNVGIGTTNPSAKLDVVGNTELNGNLTVVSNASSFNIRGFNGTIDPNIAGLLSGTTSGSLHEAPINAHAVVALRENGGADGFAVVSGGGDYTTDNTHDTLVLFAGASGNVGIGTATPSHKFDVQGGTGIVGRFSGRVIGGNAVNSNEFVTKSQLDSQNVSSTAFVQDGNSFGTTATIGTNDAHDLLLETSGSERIRILAGGNVGIGTSAPGVKLDVAGSGTTTNIRSSGFVEDASGRLARNLVSSHSWTIGSGSVGIFNVNGSATENEREWGSGPHGNSVMLWKAVPDGGNSADGGWSTDHISIDHTKTYRFTTWIKKSESTDGTTYFGTGGGGSSVLTLGGASNSNPYFWSGNLPQLDRWYLLVGYVHGSGNSNTTHYGGIYDGETGKKVSGTTDFKSSPTTTSLRHRSYLYYTSTTTSRQRWWDPRMEEVNGFEPTVEAMLGLDKGATQDANRYFGGNVGIGTTSPSYKLDVQGGDINTSGVLRSTVATGTAPLSVSSTTKVTNLNADLLDGYNSAQSSTASTVAVRNSSGDINARLFRSEYDSTNSNIGYIMTQIDTASNNYIRPSTPAQLVTGLGLEAGGSRDVWVEKAGDTMTGNLTLQGSSINMNAPSTTSSWARGVHFADSSGTTWGGVGMLGSGSTKTRIYLGHGASPWSGDGLFILPNGNVGIGTTSPSYKLDVQGGTGIVGRFSGRVIGADAANSNEFVTKAQLDAAGGGDAFVQGGNSFAATAVLGTNDAQDLVLETSGTEHLRLAADGSYTRIQADSELQLSGNSNSLLRFSSGDSGMLLGNYASGGYTYIQSGRLQFQNTNDYSVNFEVTNAGHAVFTPRTDSTTAFEVQNAGGTSLLTVDSTNSKAIVSALDVTNDLTVTGNTTLTGTLAVSTLGTTDTDAVLCHNTSNQLAACSSTFATGSGQAILQGGNSFGAAMTIGTNDAQKLNLQTNGTDRLIINSAGQVNIGGIVTTQSQLSVKSDSATQIAFGIEGAASQTADLFQVRSSGTANGDILTVAANGNVGIGTASPSVKLDVAGSARISGNLDMQDNKITDVAPATDVKDAASAGYVQSRLQNLVTNGNGLLLDNTNFSGFTYEGAESYAGGGSFKIASGSTSRHIDELVPVDPSRSHRMSYAIKLLDDNGGETFRHYGMVTSYDADRLQISTHHVAYTANTETTLAADLNPGDTTIELTDASNWYTGGSAHARNINFYGYTNSHGYTYPDYTYSRNSSNGLSDFNGNGAYETTGISGNTITLREPWPGSSYASGTAVANAQSGGTHNYIAGVNEVTPSDWTVYEGTIGSLATPGTTPAGNFRQGTAFVKPGWLLNRDGASPGTTAVDAVTFELEFGDMNGSGTANRLAMFDSEKNITDSYFLQSAGALTLDTGKDLVLSGGDLQVTGAGTFTGSVGIGTTSPSYKLDVEDGDGTTIVGRFTGRVIGADAVNDDEFVTKSQLDAIGAPPSDAFVQGGNSFGALAQLGTTDDNDLAFLRNSAELARLTSSGLRLNAIDTATSGTQYASNDMMLQGSAWDTTNTQAVNRQLSFRTITGSGAAGSEPYRLGILNNDDTEFVSFDGLNQRVGIGTSSPARRLEVVSQSSSVAAARFHGGSSVGAASAGSGQILVGSGAFNGEARLSYSWDDADLFIDNAATTEDSDIVFRSGANNEHLRIKGTGLTGIGVTDPQEQLDIDGAIRVGSTSNTNAGTMRWTGTDFEGYSGSAWLSLTSGGGSTAFVQGGNSFAATAVLGTNDAHDLVLETSGAERLRLADDGSYARIQADASLQLSGNSNALLRFNSGDNGMLIGNYASGGYTYIQSGKLQFQNTNDYSVNFEVTNAGHTIFTPRTDSTTSFQVQNAGGGNVLGIDTVNGQAVLGTSSSMTGKLVVHNATNANTITVTSAATSSSYDLVLPASAGSAGECLKNSATPGTLQWGSCGGGGGGTQTTNLIPEFAGGTLVASGTDNSGTMTASHINGLSAAQGYKHNFYEWSTNQSTAQNYDVVLNHALPNDFGSAFAADSWKVWTYVDSTAGGDLQITIRDTTGAVCVSSESIKPSAGATWEQIAISGDPNTGCSFAANDIITVEIKMISVEPSTDKVRLGEVEYRYDP